MEPSRTRIAAWFTAVAGIAVLAAAAFLFLRPPAPQQRELDLPPPRPAAVEAPRPAPPPARPLAPPEPQEIDSLLAAISRAPSWARWLAQGDPIRRAAVVLDNLAEGASPRKALPFLEPRDGFTAETIDGRLVPTVRSQKRYDGFAEAISAVESPALVAAWRRLHPALEATWRALGYPDGSLDARAAEALQRIVDAPAPASVELIDTGRYYVYSDPELEQMGAVEKHLLRMGRRNQRLIQAKARELLTALRLTAKAQR